MPVFTIGAHCGGTISLKPLSFSAVFLTNSVCGTLLKLAINFHLIFVILNHKPALQPPVFGQKSIIHLF
jgi:hypothetical protein